LPNRTMPREPLNSRSPEINRADPGRRERTVSRQINSGKVMAFLQARMASTRLPGKVLMRIRGQSILERAIRRLRAARSVDEVAVLTTILDEDDAIVDEACRLGALVHRGPALDVLTRFQEAAETYVPGILIRATADNPLIDIGSVNRIVNALRSRELDYCMEVGLPYGAATEALTPAALEAAHLRAHKPEDREHVTLYIKEHPDEFRSAFLQAPEYLNQPRIRLTVDTLDDFVFMTRLIGRFPGSSHPIPLRRFLEAALTVSQERECKERCTF
jgi:spore coat polysaccharide biosynthesis protein SpsF